jgi:acyl-CoA thioesterase-1
MPSLPTVTIVYMGDSITFGQYVDPGLRWTSLVDQRLRASLAGEATVVSRNSGISGETTRMALERFPRDLQELAPDAVTLQFGLNDCNCWQSDRGLPRVSEAAYVANLTEMIDRARHFGAREIVLSTNHPTLRRAPLPSGEPYEEANARYSELARGVAAETGVTLCDVRAAFEPLDDEELDRLLLPPPDHLHLSIAGNALYADVIWPYVEEAVAAVVPQGVGVERA